MTRAAIALKPGGLEPLKWSIRRTCVDPTGATLIGYYSKSDEFILLHTSELIGAATVDTISETITGNQSDCLLGFTGSPAPDPTEVFRDSVSACLDSINETVIRMNNHLRVITQIEDERGDIF